jgi:hypothetical protein
MMIVQKSEEETIMFRKATEQRKRRFPGFRPSLRIEGVQKPMEVGVEF